VFWLNSLESARAKSLATLALQEIRKDTYSTNSGEKQSQLLQSTPETKIMFDKKMLVMAMRSSSFQRPNSWTKSRQKF
jgi:hypothetical protein